MMMIHGKLCAIPEENIQYGAMQRYCSIYRASLRRRSRISSTIRADLGDGL
jgi:hypothetical protein